VSLSLRDLAGCFEGWVPSALATCSADGTPNVAMVSQVYLVDDDHVGVTNQFFGKTTANLAENRAAAVIVTEAETYASYQLELRFERTETAGTLFDRLARSLDAIAALTGMSGVFRLRGVDIYQVLSIAKIPSAARPPPPAADGTPHG
jgi:adenylate cyclase